MNGYPTNLGHAQGEGEVVSGPLRIFLRGLGLLMLIAGGGFLLAVAIAGPNQVAEWAGQNCATESGLTRTAGSCSTWDVIRSVPVALGLIPVGAVLFFALRRS
jgi:hypothetical protein